MELGVLNLGLGDSCFRTFVSVPDARLSLRFMLFVM